MVTRARGLWEAGAYSARTKYRAGSARRRTHRELRGQLLEFKVAAKFALHAPLPVEIMEDKTHAINRQ